MNSNRISKKVMKHIASYSSGSKIIFFFPLGNCWDRIREGYKESSRWRLQHDQVKEDSRDGKQEYMESSVDGVWR